MFAEQCVVVTKVAASKGSQNGKGSSPRLQKTTSTNEVPPPPTGQVINISPVKVLKPDHKGRRNKKWTEIPSPSWKVMVVIL